MKPDVLIIGAGPSGLVLANVLADRGVNFRIVDKKPGPVGESRAVLVHVRTLELLDRLGLAERAIARGVKTNRVEVHERGRHTTSFPLVGRGPEGLTPFPYALGLEQDRTEQLLVEGLAEHHRNVEWNTECIALTQHDGETQVVLRGPEGTDETVSARWVIGADGTRSPVRHMVNVDFVGKTYDLTGLLADVEIDLPEEAEPGPGTIRLSLARGGFVGIFRLNNGRWRVFGAVPRELLAEAARNEAQRDFGAPVNIEEIQRWFDENFLVDARLKHAAWTALFRIHSRIAERFRSGNVFLVGDAAHTHSPAGGQGMNLGIGDGFNLGWKLALVAEGLAHESLLLSYEAERFPIARSVLRGSDRGFMLEATSNPAAVWLRANLAPRVIGPLLRLRPVQARIFRLFAQTWISYRGSPAVAGDTGHSDGPLPGDRAPYGAFIAPRTSGPRNVFDLLAGTSHDLLLFEGPKPHPALDAYRRAIDEVLGRYLVHVRVHVIPSTEVELHHTYGAVQPRMFLIRPDGHVSYRGSLAELGEFASHLDVLYTRTPTNQEASR